VDALDGIEVTGLQLGEELDFARAVSRHFHEDDSDEALKAYLPVIETDRAIVARDRGRIVGNYGVDTTTISVPGAGSIPCAAVTAVGVSQTHRRRGLLRRMMERGLDQAVERGEPVAALFASESAIYGRFGFGVSAPAVRYRVDRAHASFRDPVDPRLVVEPTVAEALAAWPTILEAAVEARRGGCVGRSPAQWRMWLENDPPSWRDGASARRLAQVPERGFVAYRVKDDFQDALPAGEVRVQELVAADPEAEQALWQHVLDIDLTSAMVAGLRPPDDALPWLLSDRLRARSSEGPPMYTRLLDVPTALTARSYASAGTFVLAVHDADRDQSGTYRLEAGADGATCERTSAAPDLSLTIDALSSLWLGGVSPTQLLAARRLEQHTRDAAAGLGRLFAVDLQPWTPFEF
jgi:predicted acetyltransferase